MGMNIFKRSCHSNPYAAALQVPDSNPRADVFIIEEESYINGFLLLKVRYPHCTNFEGLKLMLYTNFTSSKELLEFNKGLLDPHFADNKGAPVVRVTPSAANSTMILKLILGDSYA